MNLHLNTELDSHLNARSERLVMVRCTLNRSHKRVSTGIHVNPKFWDFKQKLVKKSHPLAAEYNSKLRQLLITIEKAYLVLTETTPNVTLLSLVQAVAAPRQISFFDFAENTKLSKFKAKSKLGTFRRYEATLSKLGEYTSNRLTLNQVDYAFLTRYENYLLEVKGNSRDTVSSNLSVIRSVVNEAIRQGAYTGRNPFEMLSLAYTDNTKEKLTVEELKRLEEVVLPERPYSLRLARDFFLSCFYAGGCRGGDMVLMRWDNVKGDTLSYQQQKTGKSLSLPLLPTLACLFNRHKTASPFIFPLLNEGDEVNELVVNSKLTYVNKYLKEVCKYAGVFKKVSSHCARHTFADISLDLNQNDIYSLRDALGHSSVKTTEIYLRKRNLTRVKPFVEKLATLTQ